MAEIDENSPQHVHAVELLSSLAREAAEAKDQVVRGLLEAYRQQGYGEGYHRAISEVLTSLVVSAEDFIRRQNEPSSDLRPVLYAFVEHLDHRIRNVSTEQSFVEGGLGI